LKTIINDTCDVVFKRVSDNAVVFTAEAQLASVTQSITETPIRGGLGNPVIANLKSDKTVDLKVRNAVWDTKWLETVNGTTFSNETATVYKKETDLTCTGGTYEVASLSVTASASGSGNITVTLNGVAKTVAVASGDTATDVAGKIRSASFPGWITGGNTTTVTFTATTKGTKTDAEYSAGTTGATGTMTTTTQGDSVPTTITITGTPKYDNAITVIAADGTQVTGTNSSGTVTFTGGVDGAKYTALYQVDETTAQVLELDSQTFASAYMVEYHTIEYDIVSNTVVKDLYWQFDQAQPLDNWAFSFENGKPIAPEIDFKVLKPMNSTTIGKVIEVAR
jgi:hypothetical protein